MSHTPEHTPETDELIRSVMDKHPRLHQMGAYYEDVHQELAPLARKLEMQRDELLAALKKIEEESRDTCLGTVHYFGDIARSAIAKVEASYD